MNDMAGINAPEPVARFHEAYSAPTRAIVLRILLKKPRSYTELFDLIPEDVMSRNSVHEALKDLGRLGYVEDDAPEDLKRRPPKTTFWANRELIADDLGATVAHLLG
jgi:DNA-binding transcriptional ArsR family regulator